MYYATLYQIKQALGLPSSTSDDARLTEYLRWSTGLIEAYKARRYDVRLATIPHDTPQTYSPGLGRFDSSRAGVGKQKRLILLDDLLALDTLTNGDGEVLTSDNYMLEPYQRTPFSVIALRGGAMWSVDVNGDVNGAILVKGYWGYHPNYPDAWVDSLDTVLDNPLSNSATQIHVADITGIAADLISPRFQPGQLLRIEAEYLQLLAVEAVVGGDDHLTVKRAVNGTTAAAHAAGKAIEIFRPDVNIGQACVRLVQWRYTQKDSDNFDKAYAVGTGVVSVPASLPADVRDLLGSKGRPPR